MTLTRPAPEGIKKVSVGYGQSQHWDLKKNLPQTLAIMSTNFLLTEQQGTQTTEEYKG